MNLLWMSVEQKVGVMVVHGNIKIAFVDFSRCP